MTISSLLAPMLGVDPAELRADLVEVAPGAIVVAVALVLLTAVSVVALVLEVRRDGYGHERPRPLSLEFPWQLEAVAGRPRSRAVRARRSRPVLRASRAAHR
jgi:hypothetical protein